MSGSLYPPYILAQVLFFIKYYDPFTKSLSYMGHLTETINQKFGKYLIYLQINKKNFTNLRLLIVLLG